MDPKDKPAETTTTTATETTQPDPAKLFAEAVTAIEAGNTPATNTPAEGEGEKKDTASEGATTTATTTATTETKTAATTEAKKPAAAATTTTTTAAADAELAGLPDSARAIVERIQADAASKIAEAQATAQRHQTQVGGLNQKLREARTALEQAQKTADPNAIAKAKVAEAAATEALKKVKADYPDIASAIEGIKDQVLESVRRELGSQIAAVQKQVEPIARTHATSLEQLEVAAIEAAHPGWEKEIETEQFQQWWAKQSTGVQALAKGNEQDEISLFNLYRQAHPLQDAAALQVTAEKRAAADALAARRAQQQKDAAGPSGRRTQAPPQSQDTATPAAMFAAAVAKIEREMRPAG
jgi:hypothetical protein